jgi:sugar lactone lactonase YvrE
MQTIRQIITAIFVIIAVTGYSQVPNTETFSLQDIVDEVNPSSNDLNQCFIDAKADGFDPDYEENKDELDDFRNYCTPWYLHCFDNILDEYAHTTVDDHSGLYFKSDGSIFYVVDEKDCAVYEFPLTTDWRIGSVSLINADKYVFADSSDYNAYGLYFKPDGTKMYTIITVKATNDNYVYSYNLSTAWDLSTASFNNLKYTEDGAGRDLYIKPDGTTLYVLGTINDKIYVSDLQTAWDVTSRNFIYSVDAGSVAAEGMFFTSDGKYMYISEIAGGGIKQYNLSSTWDLTSRSVEETFDPQGDDPTGMFIKTSPNYLYYIDPVLEKTIQYD